MSDLGGDGHIQPTAFSVLPLGSISPRGWLEAQLRAQLNGLSGHVLQFWDRDSWWLGGAGVSDVVQPAKMHVGPDILNGLVPLAWMLDDQGLKDTVHAFADHAWHTSQQSPTGRFGPPAGDVRPYDQVADLARAKAMQALISFHEATEDPRVIEILSSYFRGYFVDRSSLPRGWFNDSLQQENLVAGTWLFQRTGDPALKEILVRLCHPDAIESQWAEAFGQGRVATEHGYAIAHALKYPAYRYLIEGRQEDVDCVYRVLNYLKGRCGQIGGRFAGHEFLPREGGLRPTNGTETCTVVEHMYSLEKLLEIVGDPLFADQLEELAFNALPAACSGDFWARQYDQQTNQVMVTTATREFDNGPFANLFALQGNYICCTGNMHQGWPRFVQHLWMRTADDGIVATTYGPSEARFSAGGQEVRVLQVTDYPFAGEARIVLDMATPVEFPIYLRIPGWAMGTGGERTRITAKGQLREAEPGQFLLLKERWLPGDVIDLEFPMPVQVEHRSSGGVSFRRGPLYLALRIAGEYNEVQRHAFGSADWEVRPRSPWNVTPIANSWYPGASINLERNPVTHLPFASLGEPIYDRDADAFAPWPHREPVVGHLKGRITTNWRLHPVWASADDPPRDPAVEPDAFDIELVPYGSTRLRIAEFPRADRALDTVRPSPNVE